jgi:hypothetical protein
MYYLSSNSTMAWRNFIGFDKDMDIVSIYSNGERPIHIFGERIVILIPLFGVFFNMSYLSNNITRAAWNRSNVDNQIAVAFLYASGYPL